MLSGTVLALFWAVIVLLGGLGGVCFVLGLKGL